MAAPTTTTPDYEFEKLKLLFDYTKFHIGLYTTIATIFGGLIAASAKDQNSVPFRFNLRWLLVAVLLLCVAGMTGGILTSSMCHEKSLKDFWNKKIGPLWFSVLKAEHWTYVEHIAFWLAMAFALWSVLSVSNLWLPSYRPPGQ